MKKLILLLAFLPILANALECPQNIDVKITCISNQVKKVIHAGGIPTQYNTAFPECKIQRGSSLRDRQGNFRIYYIAKDLCKITDYTKDVKVRFASGRNWFFGKWLKNVARAWVYTPDNKKFKAVN